ncbi:MAG TPA: MATE family efflux transporter [Cellulomonas sp.]
MTRNLTLGPPTRLIVLFTLPLLVGNVFQQLYQFTDAAVVGRLVGLDGLGAVGATNGLVFLLIGFTWGSSAGLAIPTARAFGAGDMAAMRRFVAAGVYVSIAIAALITVVGSLAARPLLQLMNTPPELIDGSTAFLVTTFAGSAAMVAFNFLSSTIRALGDSRTPLVFLVISCCLNAGLVYVFVAWLHLGVRGAALATVTAQLVSVALCLRLISRKMPELHLSREDWRPRRELMAEPVRIGLPMGFQMSVIAIGSLVLQYAINGLGAESVAAFTAAMRVDQLAAAPLNSFGIAMATYVAQNRGARQWRRIRVGVFRISFVSVALAIVVGLTLIAVSGPIARLFVGGGQDYVVALVRQYFVVNGALYSILAMVFIMRNTAQGLGLSAVPTLSGFLELVMRASAGLLLVQHLGFLGVCLAAPLAWTGSVIPTSVAWVIQRRRLIEAEELEMACPAAGLVRSQSDAEPEAVSELEAVAESVPMAASA